MTRRNHAHEWRYDGPATVIPDLETRFCPGCNEWQSMTRTGDWKNRSPLLVESTTAISEAMRKVGVSFVEAVSGLFRDR